MDCTTTPAQSHHYTRTVTTGSTTTLTFSRANNGATPAVVPSQQIRLYKKDYSDTNCEADGKLYDEDADTRDEGPFDDEEDEPYWSDSDYDPALRYYNEDGVAYQRSNGLDFHESHDGGFWYTPGGGYINCDQQAKGVVFEEDD